MRKIKLTSIKKFSIFVCTFALITTGGITIYKQYKKVDTSVITNHKINILPYLRNQYIVAEETNSILNIPSSSNTLSILTKPDYNISLSEEYQDLVYQLCENNDLSYELVLSIMFQESRFNPRAINYNTNNTRDYGLFQLNSKFINTHRERAIKYCKLSQDIPFDVWNQDHNIRAGIGGIIEYRNYYKKKGVSNEEMLKYISNTLQLGVDGYARSIRITGTTSRSYSRLIYKNKEILETTHTLRDI